MDLLQLEHFLAVVDEGSFTRAAGEAAQERVWRERAGGIEAAVMAGHAAALGYLQDHHTFVRTGHHGRDKRTGESTGKWLDGKGLVAGQFLQHDSRARDPQLHVHGPVAPSWAKGPKRVRGRGPRDTYG